VIKDKCLIEIVNAVQVIPISVFIDTWNITYSWADILYSDKIRQHLAGHLLGTDNDKDIWVYSITRRFLADVQTIAQKVPVRGTSILI